MPTLVRNMLNVIVIDPFLQTISFFVLLAPFALAPFLLFH
jgi:hypothetical protein